VYWSHTCKSILTLEWIDGIKLTDAERISKANLNRKRMIDEVFIALYNLYCIQTLPFLSVLFSLTFVYHYALL
jgi:predicted unusual protein kinase regulating ubiquinone biosynthesis (AarF/ABC1/UbiB family)